MAQVEEGTAEQAKEKASQAVGGAQEKAQQAMHEGRGRLREQVDQRSTDFGRQARSTAEALRSTSEQLRGQGKENEAKAAEKAAERAERVGGYLERSDGEAILADVEDFARQSPWAVVAGGLLAGFAASRMLKASSSRRYESGGSGRGIELAGMDRTGPSTGPIGARPALAGTDGEPVDPALGRS